MLTHGLNYVKRVLHFRFRSTSEFRHILRRCPEKSTFLTLSYSSQPKMEIYYSSFVDAMTIWNYDDEEFNTQRELQHQLNNNNGSNNRNCYNFHSNFSLDTFNTRARVACGSQIMTMMENMRKNFYNPPEKCVYISNALFGWLLVESFLIRRKWSFSPSFSPRFFRLCCCCCLLYISYWSYRAHSAWFPHIVHKIPPDMCGSHLYFIVFFRRACCECECVFGISSAGISARKSNVPRHGGREGKRNGNSNSIKIQSLYREIAIQLIINFINWTTATERELQAGVVGLIMMREFRLLLSAG